MEAVGFTTAAVLVTGLGVAAAWAVVTMFKSLMQAQELMVQNSFVFQR
jgi:hypothetical protein